MSSPHFPQPLPQCRWNLPQPHFAAPTEELLAIGADLAPETLISAYRLGLFPMPAEQSLRIPFRTRQPRIAWWSPNPRGILPLDQFRSSRSLRQSCRKYEIRFNTAFKEVVLACATTHDSGNWISPEILSAYLSLHEKGWAHSVETWDPQSQSLVGGLYGVSIGGFFAGESMFHRLRDASKVALSGLIDHMRVRGAALLDVQWITPHLESLGAEAIPRETYLGLLQKATALPVQLFL